MLNNIKVYKRKLLGGKIIKGNVLQIDKIHHINFKNKNIINMKALDKNGLLDYNDMWSE